ncbi:MAG: Hpt domain-containing protein, partial [Methylococcales bacterium]|nr:Hpt domain-containing protein [Methylococcales bacterium]
TMAKWISPESPVTAPAQDENDDAEMQNEVEFELPKLIGIDCDIGLAIAQGNRKLYRRLLIKFLESEQNFTEQFHQAQQSDDTEAATRVAHTLKGVAGNIGAKEVQEAAHALEQACINGVDEERIETLLEAVVSALTPVLESLKQIQLVQKKVQQANQSVNVEELIPLFQKLLELLKDDDADAIEVLDEIVGIMGDSYAVGQLKGLENLIEQYAYDEAIEKVKAISGKLSIKIT